MVFYQTVAQRLIPSLPNLPKRLPDLRNLPKYRRGKAKTAPTRPQTPTQAEIAAKKRAERIAKSRERISAAAQKDLQGLTPEERARYDKKKAQEAAGSSEEVIEVSSKDAFAGLSPDWIRANTISTLLDMGCPNDPKTLTAIAGLVLTAIEIGGVLIFI